MDKLPFQLLVVRGGLEVLPGEEVLAVTPRGLYKGSYNLRLINQLVAGARLFTADILLKGSSARTGGCKMSWSREHLDARSIGSEVVDDPSVPIIFRDWRVAMGEPERKLLVTANAQSLSELLFYLKIWK